MVPIKINILTDNRARKRGFLAEHGLSVYIQSDEANILFDTGQSDVFVHNAAAMDVDLAKTDYIVLSHGHYDHCGGLIHFPKSLRIPPIYVHEAAFGKRYVLSSDGKTCREIGIPWSLREHVDIKRSLVCTSKTTEIAANVFLCGDIPPSTASVEEIPNGFYIGDEEGKSNDMMQDEQMLIFDTVKGLYIFLGCSHPGIVNCLNYAREQFPGKKINTLVAGMHLGNASCLRLHNTVEYILDSDIQKVVPLHCTGILGIAEMKRLLGNRCFPLCAGDSLDL